MSTNVYLVRDLYPEYTEHTQLKNKKWTPLKKQVKDVNRHFSKDDVQMASKHKKRCSVSEVIREKQIKIIMR
jgi:hypothetical protein